ncbi:hypothetical protein WA588_002551, partial [Blastocystis sp. NMH]
MEQISDYSEEFEAVTSDVVLDDGEQPDNPLNEFATDMSISEVDRIKKYAMSPMLVQRYTFIREIKRCCENGDFDGIYNVIIPILETLVGDRDSTIRATVINQFTYIAKLCFSHDYQTGVNLLTTVLFPILSNSVVDVAEEVQEASIQSFVSCIRNFHPEDQGTYSFLFILRFAHDVSKENRIVACKLFHASASALGSEVLSNFGIWELLLLARDPYSQVRKRAILALGPVSNELKPTVVESGVYECLMSNTQSSSWVVRRACAIVIPEVFQNIRSHNHFINITRMVGELFRDDNKWVKQAMLQGIGHLIAVSPSDCNVSEDLKTRYHQLGDTKDDLPSNLFCRCCAFFFPAVLRYVSSSTSFWKDMNDLYHRLVKHKDDIVRRSLAYSLHEVAQIIGVASTERYLVKIQSCFLVDKIDIQMGVVKNLAKFWKAL